MPAPVLMPSGVSPASGEPGVVLEPPGLPPVMRAMLIDANTGERLSLTREAHPIDAAIMRQFRTVLGTGVSVSADGNAMRKTRKNDAAAPILLNVEAERIMAPYVASGAARVDGVDVVAGEDQGNAASVTVRYTNLATGKSRKVGPLPFQLAGAP